MNNFIIYILTDNNRSHFEIGLSTNIFSTVSELQHHNQFIASQTHIVNRIIYTEACSTLENARKKMNELQNFTRMQLERLVRKYNPDWNNLFPPPQQSYPKRNISYAA